MLNNGNALSTVKHGSHLLTLLDPLFHYNDYRVMVHVLHFCWMYIKICSSVHYQEQVLLLLLILYIHFLTCQ